MKSKAHLESFLVFYKSFLTFEDQDQIKNNLLYLEEYLRDSNEEIIKLIYEIIKKAHESNIYAKELV